MNYDSISFPNLGIGEIKLNPVLIETEYFSIHWYAVFIVIGMVLAFLVCNRLRKKMGVGEDDFLDCIIYTIPVGFIGARLMYVLFERDNYHSFKDVIAVWDGGLSIYGGIIFAMISVFVISKLKKCDFRQMFDIMAIGFLIGQIIGRLGNFVNIEVYGVETNLPWAMGIGYYGEGASELVHPLFLYEMLWNTVGFILIYGYRRFRKFNGEIFLWYMAWYGLGRALMEPLRNPTFNLTEDVGSTNVMTMCVIAGAFCVASVAAVIICRIRANKDYIPPEYISEEETAEPEYETQFDVDMNEIELTEQDYESKKLFDALDKLNEEEKPTDGENN